MNTTGNQNTMPIPAINADLVRCRGRRPWLVERTKRLHSTDAAFGFSTGDWLPVFASKTAAPHDDESTEAQRIKLDSETTVRKVARWKFASKVHAWPGTTIAVCKLHPWLACTPDGLLEDAAFSGPGVHQIKCWSEMDRGTWLDGRPLYVQVQNQIELLCTGCTWGATDVMFGTQSVERFYFEPDPEFLAAALPVLKSFWDGVLLGNPPAPTGSQASADALRRLHPHDNGLTVQLPPGADEVLHRLEVKRALVSDTQRTVDGIENELRAAIGDNTYAVTPNGRWFSWKTTTAGHRVFRQCGRPPGPIEYAPGSVANASDYANAPTRRECIELLLAKQNYKCELCGDPIKPGSPVYSADDGALCCRRCANDHTHDVATTI